MRILGRGRTCTAAVITVTWMSLVSPVRAAPIFVGGGGYDYYAGPDGQWTQSVMAVAGAEAGGRSASLALMRYSDSMAGDGMGYVLGLGISLTPRSALRAWGTRFVGDETLRSWRVKAGPLVEFPGGGTAGLYFSHAEDNAGFRSNGGSAELTTPLGARFTGRAGAAYATASGGIPATQATVGLGFASTHGVELSAETGLARNASFVTSPGSGSLGGSETSRMEPVLLLGVRVLLP